MNRLSRFFSVFLSLSLILVAPGLAPYQAAAQTMATRVVVPGRLPTAFGSGTSSPYGSVVGPSILPFASLQTGLIPSLSPSAALTPILSAPVAVSNAAVPVSAAAAAVPLALKAVMPAAAMTGKAVAPVSALAVLNGGTNALNAAAKTTSADAPRVALDGLFEGSISRPEALAVSGRSAASDSPRLSPSESRGPRWVKTLRAPNDSPPATSLKRTLSVGFLAAVIPLAITMVAVVVAQLLGYELHPSYVGPAAASPSILSALAMFVGAAVMAPVSEEAIFRGGMQGRLARLSAKLRLGSFVAPAVITSLIFVALHETADPLLFTTRFVHAMILSYVYHKEGILASIAAHGFFNGLLSLSVVFTALGLPWLGLAVIPAAFYFAFKAAKVVKSQKPDIASGALAPKTMSGALALLFAAILMLGYFFIMPNIFWPIGAVALLINGIAKLKKNA